MKKKKYFLYLLVFIIFLIFGIRLYFLSVLNGKKYNQLLENKTKIVINGSSAPRGRILDVNGNILVDNKGVKNIYYNKIKGTNVSKEIEIAKNLVSIIDIEEANTDELKEYWLLCNNNGKDLITKKEYRLLNERKLTKKNIYNYKIKRINNEDLARFSEIEKKIAHIYALMNKGYKYEKKLILKNCSEQDCAKVVEANLSGITVEVSWERIYPYNDTLRSILGSIGSIPKEQKKEYLEKGYELTDIVGLSFLEKQYEEYLKGKKAIYLVNKDNTLSLLSEAKKGNDLVLSIDINMQIAVDNIIKDKLLLGKQSPNTEYYKESYALISNPNTGEVMAMSGLRLNDDKSFSDIASNMITSSFTIGSTVKGATIGVGYKYNLFKPGAYITDGCVKLYFIPQKCSYKRLGKINDLTALAQSSNYFQFLIAINLTGNKYRPNMKINATKEHFNIYRDMLKSYGLGAITGIDLPNEQTGIEGSTIADDLLLNLSIGQYDTYTPVEVLQYINSIASSNRIKLSLMNKIVNEDKVLLENNSEVLNKVDVTDENMERIRIGLNKVLLEGTGKGFVNKELNPVGKTGTSETFYEGHKTISKTFAGYFPKDNPKYSVVVLTPHIFNKDGKNDIKYLGTVKITREITDFLANY